MVRCDHPDYTILIYLCVTCLHDREDFYMFEVFNEQECSVQVCGFANACFPRMMTVMK